MWPPPTLQAILEEETPINWGPLSAQCIVILLGTYIYDKMYLPQLCQGIASAWFKGHDGWMTEAVNVDVISNCGPSNTNLTL